MVSQRQRRFPRSRQLSLWPANEDDGDGDNGDGGNGDVDNDDGDNDDVGNDDGDNDDVGNDDGDNDDGDNDDGDNDDVGNDDGDNGDGDNDDGDPYNSEWLFWRCVIGLSEKAKSSYSHHAIVLNNLADGNVKSKQLLSEELIVRMRCTDALMPFFTCRVSHSGAEASQS